MIPVTLKIAGFLSYAEPVEVDFTEFELACISGQNGAGKSSLLDAITWALFGIARKRDDSIINTRKKTAEVAFQFEHEGNLYRIIRSRTAGKTAILEFFVKTAEGWVPLTEATMSRTEERIRKTLRLDYETFTNASFFLQGKADQFAQQIPTDRKRILGNILGLEIWEEYRARAAEKRKDLEMVLNADTARVDEIRAELDEEAARQEKLKDLEEKLAAATRQRLGMETLITTLRKQAAILEEQKKQADLWQSQLQQKEAQVRQFEDRLAGLQAEEKRFTGLMDAAPQIEADYQQWQADLQALQSMDKLAASFHQQQSLRANPLVEIEKQKAGLEQQYRQYLEGQQQAIESDGLLPQLQAEFANLLEQHNLLEEKLAARPELEARLQQIIESQANLNAENARLVKDMHELKDRMNQLEAASGADCPLCGQPLQPNERQSLIKSLEKQGLEMGNQHRENKTLIATAADEQQAINRALAELDSAQQQLRSLQRQVDQQGEKIRNAQETVNLWNQQGEPELQKLAATLQNNTYALEARASLAEIDDLLKQMGYDPQAHDQLRSREKAGQPAGESMRELEKARAALQPLKNQIEDNRNNLATSARELKEIQKNLDVALQKYEIEKAGLPDIDLQEREFKVLQEDENALRLQVGAARQKVDVLADLKARKAELEDRTRETRIQIGRYQKLEKACGKDGVPALLIEQALPDLENQANDILDRLSAGSMSVRFITQAEYKSKKREDKKETLDILINDSAGTRSYELFSGGEAFRVNFAIRLALARVLAQRAGARLQTLVIDEGFGSQDSQGKQRLIEAINLVRQDFAKILVITHLEELKDAFPARIEVEKVGLTSTVRVLT
jgi:exonuclease SbcC